MPGEDGSGPMGRGAMTGRGRGFCAEPEGSPFVRGGQGGGGGRGRRRGFCANGTPGGMRGDQSPPPFTGAEPTAATEVQILEQRFASLEAEQQQVKARLDELSRDRTD